MDLTKKEIEEIIETAVEKALDTLGLDMSERNDLRRDFIYLRTRRQEVESYDETHIANDVLDKSWVRQKRIKETKRREMVENHIGKIVTGLIIGLLGYALFGTDILRFFL